MTDSINNNSVDNSSLLQLLNKNFELVQNLQSNYQRLKTQNEELLRRNTTLEKSLGDKDSSFYEMVNQKSELELKIHSLQKKCTELESSNAQYNEKIKYIESLENEREVLVNKNEEMENKYSILVEKANFVNTLNDELQAEKEKYELLSAKLREYESKIKLMSDIERNLSLVSKELTHKNFLLNERAVEIDKLKDIIAELENDIYKYKQFESQAKELLNDKISVMDEFKEFRMKSDVEYSNVVNENTILKIELEEIRNKVSESNDESTYYTSQIAELSNQLNLLDDEIRIVKSSVSDYEDKINGLLIELENKNEEILQVRNSMIASRNADFDNSLAIKEIEIKALTSQVDQLQSEINLLKSSPATNQNADIDLNLFLSENNELQSELEELKVNYEISLAKISKMKDLEEQLNFYVNQNKILELNLENSRERISDLEELLKTRYEQISLLETQVNDLIDSKINEKSKNDMIDRIDEYLNYIDSKLKIS